MRQRQFDGARGSQDVRNDGSHSRHLANLEDPQRCCSAEKDLIRRRRRGARVGFDAENRQKVDDQRSLDQRARSAFPQRIFCNLRFGQPVICNNLAEKIILLYFNLILSNLRNCENLDVRTDT